MLHPATLEEALELLGPQNILTAEQSSTVFRQVFATNQKLVPFSSYRLSEAKRANETRGEKWSLIFACALSFQDLVDHFGTNSDNQPCVWHESLRNLARIRNQYADEHGYHLVNFNPMGKGTSWFAQEDAIGELGHELYKRCDELIITQGLLGLFVTKGCYGMYREYHWGTRDVGNGMQITVGDFVHAGLTFDCFNPELESTRIGCCIERKPEFTF